MKRERFHRKHEDDAGGRADGKQGAEKQRPLDEELDALGGSPRTRGECARSYERSSRSGFAPSL
jgi:hypothetical protein